MTSGAKRPRRRLEADRPDHRAIPFGGRGLGNTGDGEGELRLGCLFEPSTPVQSVSAWVADRSHSLMTSPRFPMTMESCKEASGVPPVETSNAQTETGHVEMREFSSLILIK